MGLFSRKSSKPTVDKLEGSSLHSNGSIKSHPSPFSPKSNQSSSTMSRIPVPDIPIPKAPDPSIDPAGYLRSIHAVRERCRIVFEAAKKNQLKHFNVDITKFSDTASYVVSIIKVHKSFIL